MLYSKDQTVPLGFGSIVIDPRFLNFSGFGRFINNEGILAGIEYSNRYIDKRGFRLDPRTNEMTASAAPPDTLAWC